MRKYVLQYAGYLPTDYPMIIGHALWGQTAAIVPLPHVGEWWAVVDPPMGNLLK